MELSIAKVRRSIAYPAAECLSGFERKFVFELEDGEVICIKLSGKGLINLLMDEPSLTVREL